MTSVTTSGWETIERWEALAVVMRACARWAMNICSAGGRTLSTVPTKAHEGMVFQAVPPDGSSSAERAMGRWAAASTAPAVVVRSFAKHRAKPGYGALGCCLA